MRRSLNSVKIRYPPSKEKLLNLLYNNIDRLLEVLPTVKKIIIFGSYAKNNYHFGSDVDLLVIVTTRTRNDFEKFYGKLLDISSEFEWSPIIISEQKYDKLLKKGGPFIDDIIKHNVIIFDNSKYSNE